MTDAQPSKPNPAPRRRTQAERRAATIARLVDACIEVLSESGYAAASVKAISSAAGVSQGALFRHFDTRVALLVHVLDVVGQRHVSAFNASLSAVDSADAAALEPRRVVLLLRELIRSPTHTAWREIVSAARTDGPLREAAHTAVARFERALIDVVEEALDVPEERRLEVATTILSIAHMFDSEAVTVRVKGTPEIERTRVEWATRILAGLIADLQN